MNRFGKMHTRERSPIPVLTGPGVEQLSNYTLIETNALSQSQTARGVPQTHVDIEIDVISQVSYLGNNR